MKRSAKSAKGLKGEVEKLQTSVKEKLDELKMLAKDESQLSAELRERIKAIRDGGEQEQLDALKDAAKLKDEGVLLLALTAEHSGHDSVRRQAVKSIAALGEDGYPALSHVYDSLTNEERVLLAEQLGEHKTGTTHLLLLLMAKEADGKTAGDRSAVGRED